MRYALASVLLIGCSGRAFTGTPTDPGGTGGSVSTGGTATGGTTASGGTGGTGVSSQDASVDEPQSELLDASTDAPADVQVPYASCPPSPPPSGSSCSGVFDCAYGDDARVSCRVVHQCRNGAWIVSAKQCPPAKYCSALAVPPVNGAPCATKDDYCTYAVGEDCGCVQGATLAWKCAPKPAAPCPRKAENKGQPCEDEDAGTCTYGFCGSPERVQTACKSGMWTWSSPLCG